MSKKTVTLINYEGHQYDPDYGTGWSDTWVEFKRRRKTVKLGPTLISTSNLDRDREMFAGDPEKYGWVDPNIPEGEWEFCLPYGDDADGIPTILINKEWVTKAGIEGAVLWYLRETQEVTAEVRFRWRKNKDRLFITPV